MQKQYKVNDVVRYTGKFLRNTGMFVGVPRNGLVVSVNKGGHTDGWPMVQWCDSNEATLINPVNIELDPTVRRRQ